MGKYFPKPLLRLLKDYERGRLRDEHLDALHRNPDKILGDEGWDAKHIGMIPRECYVYSDMKFVDGKPLYIAKEQVENGKEFVVYGSYQGPKYDRIDDPIVRNGTLLYVAKSEEEFFLMWGEARCAYRADEISWHIFADDGVPTFFALEEEEWFIIRIFTDRPNESTHIPYDGVSNLSYENGKPLYVAHHDGDGADYVVWGNEEIGGPYDTDSVEGLQFIDHLPFFIARTHGTRICFERGGQLRINDDEQVYLCDRGYVLIRRKWGDDQVSVYHNGEYGERYDGIDQVLQFLDGFPLYIARRGGKRMLVYKGTETEFPAQGYLRDWIMNDGQLIYVTQSSRNPEKRCVVYRGKEGRPYDDIFSLHVDGSKLVYGAVKGRSIYRVSKDLGA